MSFKEALQKIGEKLKEKKEYQRQMDMQLRAQEQLSERRKSANERELNRYINEDREENIKNALDFYRKKRENDINFNHNPLDVPNITAHTDWQVLREKNLFKGNNNMFRENRNVLHNNPNLLKNNKKLFGL